MPVSVTVERMWIETVSGLADALSFSQSELVTEIANPAGTVPVYSRNDQSCAAVIKAEVSVYDQNGSLITSDTVSIRAAQEVQTVQNMERPTTDTTEALNQALAELAQTLDRNAIYTIQLGPEYHGTIRIPGEFEYANITITGENNQTRIYGGIDLCGGRVDVIREISFFHSDDAADATTSALWGGWCGNVIQCVFSGYPVAADATTGFLAFTNGNVFVDNQIGVKVDLSETQQGGNNSPWQYNTFLRNGTAVQVLGFNSIMSPYYFRIVDSNFIGNSTDFDLKAPGTVYLYRNYFGKIHPQAEDKTERSRRYITLPVETMQLLRRYRAWQAEERLRLGEYYQNQDFVFSQDNGKPMHPDSVTDWLKKFSKRHGLPHINAHAFRHTMASMLYFNGVDSVSISKRLGHAQVSTTANIYAHVMEEADQRNADILSEIFLKKA